jgi:hypothetical protein
MKTRRWRPGLGLVVLVFLLTGCGNPAQANAARDYVRAFKQLDSAVQQAKNDAVARLGGKSLRNATRDELHEVFNAWSNADLNFVQGIGAVTETGSVDTICQRGSFSWKINFPNNVCPDVATLWKAGHTLAIHEGALAEDVTLPTPEKYNADLEKVSVTSDQWMTAINTVRRDIGLPTQ